MNNQFEELKEGIDVSELPAKECPECGKVIAG